MAFAALAAIVIPGTALAQPMTATAAGKITIVHNDIFFGAKVDDAFTAVFTFDPTKGTHSPYNGAVEAMTAGYVPNAPVISVALTVNGKTDNWTINPGGQYYSELTRSDYGPWSGLALFWQGSNQYYQNGQPTVNGDFAIGGFNASVAGSKGVAFGTPFSGPTIAGRAGFDREVSSPGGGYLYYYQWEGALTSISAVSAVPEPATWGMLILGFGMVGGAMRYGRRHAKLTTRNA